MQKSKIFYEAPATTIVEVKACGRMCSTSSNSLFIMLGQETGSYGVQNYSSGTDSEYNW